jgi:hypothetical protein
VCPLPVTEVKLPPGTQLMDGQQEATAQACLFLQVYRPIVGKLVKIHGKDLTFYQELLLIKSQMGS